MTVRRVVEVLTPGSVKWNDAITCEITNCVNKKYRMSGINSWKRQIETLMSESQALTDTMDVPLRIFIEELAQSLSSVLNLTDQEI